MYFRRGLILPFYQLLASSNALVSIIDVSESTSVDSYHRIINTPHLRNDDTDVLCKIHIRPLLSNEEAIKCRELALDYAKESKCWEGGKMDGTKHTSYNTVDFPLVEFDDDEDDDTYDDEVTEGGTRIADNPLARYLESITFTNRIFGKLEDAFGIPREYLEYEDLFCVQYVAKVDDKVGRGMDGLELHRDGTLLSFTVLLTDPDSFSGGGTVFDCLRGNDISIKGTHILKDGSITPRQIGDCVLHSGKFLHGGQTVTSGTRIVIVGFVGVPEWLQQDGELTSATKRWGRLDVLNKRLKRQEIKSDKNMGYTVNNKRWLPSSKGVYSGWYPSIKRTQDWQENHERIVRLDAEGDLLRNILLSSEERQELYSSFEYSSNEIIEIN